MRKQRTAHVMRMALTLLVGLMFTLGTFWLVQVMNQEARDAQIDQMRNEPDYFVDNFSVVRMTPEGKPSYIVSGTKLTHLPIDDSSDIVKPFVRNLAPGYQPMDIRGNTGRVDQNNSRVQLRGNVTLDRAAGANSQSLAMRSEALTVYPDRDEVETDQPVELRVGTSVLNGVGMKVNNATQQAQVDSRVRIVYPPKQR